jgi:hypothetical protein
LRLQLSNHGRIARRGHPIQPAAAAGGIWHNHRMIKRKRGVPLDDTLAGGKEKR